MTTIFVPGRGPLWLPPEARYTKIRRRLRGIIRDERGAFLSDFLEDAINDHILGTASLTLPSNFTSLHSDHPAETGANELAGGGYARQATAYDASVAGLADNTSAEAWTNLQGAPNEVGFFGSFDASTAGNFLWWAPLDGTPFTFTATDTGDVGTSYGHGRSDDDRVIVYGYPGSALPTGWAIEQVFFIISATTDTFQLSLTQGGAAVAITSDGEGIGYFVDFRTYNNGDTFNLAAGDLDFESN